MRGGIRSEQLRERSRTAFPHRASGTAPPIEHPSTGHLRRQAIQSAKPESGPKPADRPCLRFNSAKPSGISDKPRLLPLSLVPRPSTGLPAPEPPAARRPTPPWSVNSTKRPRMPLDLQPNSQPILQTSFRPRMPQPPSKVRLQPSFFPPPPMWSQHLLVVSVPKPSPGASLINHLPRISLNPLSPSDFSPSRTSHHISPP